jgi:hypothetical protein
MIVIDNKSHDRIIKLIEKLEMRVTDLTDRNYSRALPKLGKAIASRDAAREVFDIINGNS